MGSLKAKFALRPFLAIVASLVAFLCVSAFPAIAADNDPFRYGLENNNQVFVSKRAAKNGGSFRLAISGGREARLSVQLVDIYADPSGSKRALPLGSSDFSPKSLVKFKKTGTTYSPSEEFQFFEIPFRFKKRADLSRPILGGLKISMLTKDASSDELRVESSVVGTFSYYPKGAGFNFTPSVALYEEKLIRPNSDFPPFGFLPDFPFLFNGGGLKASYTLENTGDIFLESTTEVVVKGPFLFGWGTDAVAFNASGTKAFLLPNQVFVEQVAIETTRTNGKKRDPLGFGFYEVQINVKGSLGTDLLAEDSSSRIILIFPWKFLLTALVLFLIFRRRIVSTASRSWVQIQNFREFTKKKSEKSTEPADVKPNLLESKGTYPPAPKPLPKSEPRQVSRPAPAPIYGSRQNQSVPADLMPLYPTWYQPVKPKPVDKPDAQEASPSLDSGDGGGSSD